MIGICLKFFFGDATNYCKNFESRFALTAYISTIVPGSTGHGGHGSVSGSESSFGGRVFFICSFDGQETVQKVDYFVFRNDMAPTIVSKFPIHATAIQIFSMSSAPLDEAAPGGAVNQRLHRTASPGAAAGQLEPGVLGERRLAICAGVGGR
jgi:hypothetical protein